jgi:hypothetical protein
VLSPESVALVGAGGVRIESIDVAPQISSRQ